MKYRLTIILIVTVSVVLAVTGIIVNIVASNLAEENLLRVTEENTARDMLHMTSMMTQQSMMPSNAMQGMEQPNPLTLESLTGHRECYPIAFECL